MQFVEPSTWMIGSTHIDCGGLEEYLIATGNHGFWKYIEDAMDGGLSYAECLCSFYAKLCYASLTPGKNDNLTKVRDIAANITATLESGHGSVFEHAVLNFVTTDCSRVLTHELVRHRAGTAFSQTSGRYVRTSEPMVVFDPILDPIRTRCETKMWAHQEWMKEARVIMGLGTCDEVVEFVRTSAYTAQAIEYLRRSTNNYYFKVSVRGSGMLEEGMLGERKIFTTSDPEYKDSEILVVVGSLPFSQKKKLTSALRRFSFNGEANEIGWSVNIRALRHMIMLRTNRHAEWEIRKVFNDVFKIVKERYPLLFSDAQTKTIDGLLEVTGMVIQPYEMRHE